MNILPSPSISFSSILSILQQGADLCGVGHDCLLTIDGRTALYIAIKLLSEDKPTQKWLIPAYFCPSVRQTCVDAKIPFEFYPIRDDFQPNSEYLCEKLLSDEDVGGVLFINYFGFKTDIKPYESIIKENELSVIYDCAHMLIPNIMDTMCNENEAYVYSMRKWYPIPHGGALLYKNIRTRDLFFPKCSNLQLYKQLLKYLICNIEQVMGVDFRKYLLSLEFISKHLEHRDVAERYDQLMHDKIATYFAMEMPSGDMIRQKHRNNFRYLADRFCDNGKYIPIRSKFGDEECPFIFPLVVSGGNRNEILKKCLRMKIPLRVYWRYVSDCIPRNDLFDVSNNLSDNILCLPVHYKITSDHLDRICDTLDTFNE